MNMWKRRTMGNLKCIRLGAKLFDFRSIIIIIEDFNMFGHMATSKKTLIQVKM